MLQLEIDCIVLIDNLNALIRNIAGYSLPRFLTSRFLSMQSFRFSLCCSVCLSLSLCICRNAAAAPSLFSLPLSSCFPNINISPQFPSSEEKKEKTNLWFSTFLDLSKQCISWTPYKQAPSRHHHHCHHGNTVFPPKPKIRSPAYRDASLPGVDQPLDQCPPRPLHLLAQPIDLRLQPLVLLRQFLHLPLVLLLALLPALLGRGGGWRGGRGGDVFVDVVVVSGGRGGGGGREEAGTG